MHGFNELFLGTIQWWHLNECYNEHCRQTADDDILKFLEEVNLEFIFTPVHFIIAKKKKILRKILESALTLKFGPKYQFLRKRNIQFS